MVDIRHYGDDELTDDEKEMARKGNLFTVDIIYGIEEPFDDFLERVTIRKVTKEQMDDFKRVMSKVFKDNPWIVETA